MNRDDLKNEILSRSDIIEVISEYVTLNRRGRNFIGLCPFHSEKTPSFTVSPEKQIYKCFGCGKSGNVFTFLMEKETMSFPETLKFLAGKYGIEYSVKDYKPEIANEIEEIFAVLDSSAKYFQKLLNEKSGKICREYFEARKFTKKTMEEFRLGYAPDSFDELSNYLLDQGFSEQIITDAGINVQNENGRKYDRFRNRAIFPITDIFGRVVGFGARLLTNEKTQAKYINSPQTKVYDKSKVLYGLSQGKNEIINKKYAILVEGYADVLTLHQNGFKNAVASCGTALTGEQLKLLTRYSKNLKIIYDADSAGQTATERAIEIALQNGFEPSIVKLPEGDDPDSIVRDKGNLIFQKQIDDSFNFLNFLYGRYKDKPEFTTSIGKTDVIKKLMSTINLVKDSVQQDFLIQELASMLDFNDFQIRNLYKLKEQVKTEANRTESIKKSTEEKNPAEIEENIKFEKKCSAIIKKLKHPELILLNMILKDEENFQDFKRTNFDPQKLITSQAETLVDFIVSFDSLNHLTKSLVEDTEIDEYIRSVITRLSLQQMSPSENWYKFAEANEISFKEKLNLILINLELENIETQLIEAKNVLKGVITDSDRISTLELINLLSKRKNELKTNLHNL